MQELNEIARKRGWTLNDFPDWANNSLYMTTVNGGYLLDGETPKNAYQRISRRAAELLKNPELEAKFFDILWKGWLIPATPVMANLGNDIAMSISCFSSLVGDSLYDIFRKNLEMAVLSKHGGGTAYDFSKVRAVGSPIRDGRGGTSDGIIPFLKAYDSTIMAAKQSKVRRGAVAIYLDANHKEFSDFLRIRQPKGDIQRQCHNIHQGAVINDEFMDEVINKKGRKREIWGELLKARIETGEPYMFFIDNVNRNNPEYWKNNNLSIKHSNLCNEICLPTDENHTLVCCLSSLNAARYDEWRDTDTVGLSIMFLDAVIEDFIQKASQIPGIEDSVRFAKKARALGLGVMGWHTYLQSKNLPFAGISANALTNQMFGKIRSDAEAATLVLGAQLGEPEWCKGTGRRNLTLLAVAPNRSSSKLAGGISQGIEPIAGNLYVDDDAKGTHIRRNPYLEQLLDEKGKNNSAVWDQIAEDKGSVSNIRCLSDEEKEVFLSFKEINQLELVKQAAIRQKYIDQGQSVNLSFFQNAPAKWINQCHVEAWKLGIKGLYYMRSESILRADSKLQRDLYEECISCAG